MPEQAHWKQILQINTIEGIKDMLANFVLIDEDDLKGARLKCSPDEVTAAKNMYIALWKSFVCPIKTVMQTYANNNKIDGPALLYHFLRQYTGTAESIIRTYQLNLNNLTDKLEALGYNANNTQASLKLYKALTSSIVDAFNSEIRAYKAAVSLKDKTLDFTKLTTIACAKYTSLVMLSQWPSSSKAATKKRNINDIVALKAELKRKEKIIKLFKSSTPSSPPKQPYYSTSHHTNKESNYNSKGNPDYHLKAQKHTPPKNNSTCCIHNGIRWCWCTKCESWGSHEAEVYSRNFGPRKQSTKHTYIATKNNPISVDADELLDSGSESDNTSIPSNSAFLSSKKLDE
eukprot:8287205-Ditylum_brightwellii.AAC.1